MNINAFDARQACWGISLERICGWCEQMSKASLSITSVAEVAKEVFLSSCLRGLTVKKVVRVGAYRNISGKLAFKQNEGFLIFA